EVPFHRATNGTALFASSVVLPLPTAEQLVGDAHDTRTKPSRSTPGGSDRSTRVHRVPSQRSIKIRAVLTPSPKAPTAKHDVVVAHEMLLSSAKPRGVTTSGDATILHAVPS